MTVYPGEEKEWGYSSIVLSIIDVFGIHTLVYQSTKQEASVAGFEGIIV